MNSILRKLKRKSEPYNIITAPTHEAYETNLSKTNANFYAMSHEHFRGWNSKFRESPENYHLLRKNKNLINQLPKGVDFDFVLSQNKFGQYQVLSQVAKQLHLPIISLEHTLPVPFWSPEALQNVINLRGDINVFISEFSREQWGYNDAPNTQVVHHGIDTEEFIDRKQERKNVLLSIVNDWVNRDWCCGFQNWRVVTEGLPVEVWGDTKGLSLPTKNVEHLIEVYNGASVFVNTSTLSPIPTVLLEAMSCGCAIVSSNTCMIPDVIEHGYNGLISNDPNELRKFCLHLLNEPEYARELGANARKTIIDRYNVNTFVDNWNEVFEQASKITFKG